MFITVSSHFVNENKVVDPDTVGSDTLEFGLIKYEIIFPTKTRKVKRPFCHKMCIIYAILNVKEFKLVLVHKCITLENL